MISMEKELSASAQRVQDALEKSGVSLQVIELPASTRTAQEAANAVSCQVGQIVKSLVFKTAHSNHPVLILASGSNRVSESALSRLAGEGLVKADADFVRQQTGFAIGGVPPLAHNQALQTWIDEDLFAYDKLWAAAGTPNSVFCLTPAELVRISGGKVIKITA
jgi:prolyl-tRNA editing enzyme YbaK/EbsC (Cys-tRNA(Pro) deacylase)